ncbi:hypothetical protein OS493_021745 [Desmophyllum pertusum]|uniref:Uncharacterized protein n=1 Tax=Desmophyllum pertusum TaxID=174260 RepID=A0A9W9ZZY9_9CNID|nr:hypothetical protein OS493_021745 [Desmophyllum pertusum]
MSRSDDTMSSSESIPSNESSESISSGDTSDEMEVYLWRMCAVGTLSNALEYRCCREIGLVSQQMSFDGSIEHISCITKHEDFEHMTWRTVLLQAGPLLRGQKW